MHQRVDHNVLIERGKIRRRNPLISLIVPVFNEKETLGLFVQATIPVMEGAGFDFELVFVNDGSTDGTLTRLVEL